MGSYFKHVGLQHASLLKRLSRSSFQECFKIFQSSPFLEQLWEIVAVGICNNCKNLGTLPNP